NDGPALRVVAAAEAGPQCQRLAEIAIPVSVDRDGLQTRRRTEVVTERLIVEREERLVLAVVDLGNPDRPGEGKAEVLSSADRPDEDERPLRVERLIREVIVSAAVEGIGAGVDGEVKQAGGHLAKLGSVVAGLQRELFDLLHRGLADRAGPSDLILAGDFLTF